MSGNKALHSLPARRARRHVTAWALQVAALLLLVRCGVTRCPEGTTARHDQCVRFPRDTDSGADAPLEVGPERDATHADAAEAAPDGACGEDRLWTGERCVLEEIFVDARDGDDSHAGTRLEPLKTFKQAMRIAVRGQIVSFEGLEYRTDQGDDFTVPIPREVTLRTRPGSLVSANLIGDGVQTLTFEGSATMERMVLQRFTSVTASNGEQRLTEVSFDAPVVVSGVAEMHCANCVAISYRRSVDPPRVGPMIELRDHATLRFVSGRVDEYVEEQKALCQREGSELLRVTGSANLMVEGAILAGDADRVIYLETQGNVRIVSSNVGGTCFGGAGALAWKQVEPVSPTTTLEIEDSTFRGSVTGMGKLQRVRVRRSEFYTVAISSLAPATYDFGLPGGDAGPEAGENTFSHVSVSGSDVTVFASGNTWQADVQGADAAGHYPVGDSRMVAAGESIEGRNFELTAEGGPVKLLF